MEGRDVNCQNANMELDISVSHSSCILIGQLKRKPSECRQKDVKKWSKINQKLCLVATVGRSSQEKALNDMGKQKNDIQVEFLRLVPLSKMNDAKYSPLQNSLLIADEIFRRSLNEGDIDT